MSSKPVSSVKFGDFSCHTLYPSSLGYSPLPAKQSEQVYSVPQDNKSPNLRRKAEQNTKFIIGYRPATNCMHAHTESGLVKKGRYWVYILFYLDRNIFDIKLFIVMSSKAPVYSIKDKTCGIQILLEHQIYSYSWQFYIINLSQGKERIKIDRCCHNIVSCWVKHNSLVTDFDPIYVISAFILDLHKYFWLIIPKMFVITVYKLHIFKDLMF